MKKLVVFILAALATCCTPAHSPTPHNDPSLDLESKTVALVEVDEHGDGGAYCSGVWVGDDTILTANHCTGDLAVGERLSYLVRGDLDAYKGDEIEAARLGVLVARDEAHDLALVRAPLSPPHGIAYVADGMPYVGEPTQTMGHPLGLWYSYSTGIVSALRVMDGAAGTEVRAIWFVQTTAPTSPGNSGGGLFDARGDLLGICHGSFRGGQALNLYVHAAYVRAFLRGQS